MTQKTRIFKACLICAAALLFFVAAQMQGRLNAERTDLGLTRLAPLENAPPALAFTSVALGGFRGLIANALWMRANDLQNEDKYFEMVQLADWITKLEPHFVSVWTVQAWNMAYNISVKFKDPEDRWQWVNRGIHLLRDEAIPINPHEVLIYRELAWLFQHKIGANLDDAQQLYKLRLAQEMQPLLGGRPNFDALINPKTDADREKVRQIKEKFKMDPKLIKEVDEQYGPFDWRLPDAHAIYWAELGRRESKLHPKDEETLRRVIYQSMQAACIRGGALDKSVTNVTERNFMLWPNLDLVPKASDTYLKLINEEEGQVLKDNARNAHKNFLKQIVYLLYEADRIPEANHWFTYLKTNYPNAFILKQANISLDDYCLGQIMTDNSEADMNKVTDSISATFHHAFMCVISDNEDGYQNSEFMAKRIYDHFTEKIGEISKQRLKLKSLKDMKDRVLRIELDPHNNLISPEDKMILRTRFKLPAPKAEPTPAPAATQEAQTPATETKQ
ncbi:MAG TPA: hypothetical protein VGO67_02455 [Verrucomicrobiae bacterium]|jgi:hypothetical protein